MRVLSLFDGISCGRVALEKAGIPVSAYYASEVDRNSITVSTRNNKDIIQLGDVASLQPCSVGEIDLLIGGSPCQGFSFCGNQLNFEDPRSVLFFEYARLFKELNPKYFLLENVPMKKEYQAVISEALGVEPILINSSSVSAQSRKRLYWTNIPISYDFNSVSPLVVQDILEKQTDEKYNVKHGPITLKGDGTGRAIGYIGRSDSQGNRVYNPKYKAATLVANGGGLGAKTGLYEVGTFNKVIRRLTPVECERLQTLPDGYTAGVSDTQRYKALGNGWTVDVIANIFKGLTNV